MNQGTILGSQIGRWIVLAALVVVLGALLLTIRPVGAQTSGCVVVGDDLECTYAENGTGRVYDFHATDPDRGGVVIWEVDDDVVAYPDHGAFEIDRRTGVLTFKSPPNFESPTDAAPPDNIYMVMVKAGDGEDAFASIGVTVRVTNLEEPGTVTLTNLQPQVKSNLRYDLSDADENENPSGQQWSKSRSRTSGYTNITGATSEIYSPKNEDVGYYLRVAVTYVDGAGEGHDMAMASSMYPVRQLPDEDNSLPVFPEEGLDDPDTSPATTSRKIDENTPAGMNVGPPVVATDDDLDVLTYKLGGINEELFSIDSATGQIMTKAALNFETGPTYTVTVTAADPSLGVADSTVTIMVTDLNEAPGAITGPSAIKRAEGTAVALDGADYGAEDEDEGDTVTYDVSGTDASAFMIDSNGELTFKTGKAPDFEMPGDANKDNLYEVTVIARDIEWATATKDVTIKVTNMEEDGSITLSHTHPEVETPLRATLSDLDGGETGVEWQWYRGTPPTDVADVADLPECTGNNDGCRIGGATSSTYRPKTSDFELTARTLYVVATYRDGAPNEDDSGTDDVDESKLPTKLIQAVANSVRGKVASNARPYFQADGVITNPVTKVTTYVRTIAEDAAIETVVTGDVQATDDPVDNDKLAYTLDGTDKAYFMLNTSQVIVLKKELDFDTKRRHTVTVKATDPSGGSATVTVHINVTDVDEKPEIDGSARVESYMENGTGPVATFMAKDPEGTAITWTVKPTEVDDEEFEVSRGSGSQTTLQFKKSPNYEDPTGGTNDNSNIYTVILVAAVVDVAAPDGIPVAIEMDEHTVMVRVTDVEEAPKFDKSADTLSVEENADPNEDIDLPVTAKDDDDDEDLTYSLGGRDAGSFTIIPASGQIKRKAPLDYETKNSYSVVVTATDPSGLSDTINITIEVEDEPEDPVITDGGLTVSGLALENYPENNTDAVATYTAEGENAANAGWTLEGADSGDFRLSSTSGATTMLMFRSSPNFEAPADTGTDNAYEVTVKATEGTNTATQAVTVTVIDVDEPGTVTGLPASAMVDTVLAATLTDPDAGVTNTIWQWASAGEDGTYTDIDGETSASYTVVDSDAGMSLMATATYDDVHGTDKMVPSAAVMVTAADPLLVKYDDNDNGMIDRSEVITAIRDYFADPVSFPRADVIKVIRLYFSSFGS